jgi:hypothetical protein
MGGKSTASQQTASSATKNPWEPTIDPLKGIIGQLNGQIQNTGATATEQGAFDTLTQNAQAGNPYAGQIGDFATNLLNGGGANAQAPMIQGAYDTYAKNIAPWASGAMGDPSQNSALRSMLDVIQSDVGNAVNSQFAAAGRDMSGANQQAYGRGIAQGYAPALLQAQQMGLNAAGDLYSAGNTTGGLLTGLSQTGLQNQGQGVDAATAALQARDSGANQLLNIGQQQRALPVSNIANIAGLLTPIAQLGGDVQSQGQTSGSQTMSPAQQAWGWMNAFSNLNKSWG